MWGEGMTPDLEIEQACGLEALGSTGKPKFYMVAKILHQPTGKWVVVTNYGAGTPSTNEVIGARGSVGVLGPFASDSAAQSAYNKAVLKKSAYSSRFNGSQSGANGAGGHLSFMTDVSAGAAWAITEKLRLPGTAAAEKKGAYVGIDANDLSVTTTVSKAASLVGAENHPTWLLDALEEHGQLIARRANILSDLDDCDSDIEMLSFEIQRRMG